jgi:hypothetical protein
MDYVSLAAVMFSCFALIGVMMRDARLQHQNAGVQAHPSSEANAEAVCT